MGMSPDDYLRSFVQGNLADCEADPSCVRRAFNAAVSASHMADHYYHYHKRRNPERLSHFANKKEFLAQVEKDTSGAFNDIRSISNAYKHLYVTRTESSVDSAGRIESVTYEKGESRKLTTIGLDFEAKQELRVIFTRKDGSTHDFLKTLGAVVDYWENLVWK